ncbi:MAG: DUF1282 family protein, partial [Bdellovibrionales bacterium]|nr:DUF1282 family protein [Bdellovibrionales bacterium]
IAAVSAICRFLETMSGHFFFSLVAAAISWAVSLAMVYVMAMIIEAIAPKFGSTVCSRTDAVRLLAYSATPGMLVAPIIGLLPWTLFSFIAGLVGLYGLVVLYKGITPVTGIPEQKRLVFTLTCIAAAVVLSMVVFAILGPVLVVTPQIAANM